MDSYLSIDPNWEGGADITRYTECNKQIAKGGMKWCKDNKERSNFLVGKRVSDRQQGRPSMSVPNDISNKYMYQVIYHPSLYQTTQVMTNYKTLPKLWKHFLTIFHSLTPNTLNTSAVLLKVWSCLWFCGWIKTYIYYWILSIYYSCCLKLAIFNFPFK